MKIRLVQNAPKLSRDNLGDILDCIAQCQDDIIVFPELALNGYLLQDKLSEDSFLIDELKPLCNASKTIDIIIGAAINIGSKYFNCALYFSGSELLHIHKKVHLPNYGMFEEARYFMCGDGFETFKTNYANIAMLVCEDLWHQDTVSQLFLQKPVLIFVLAASPARGFQDKMLQIQEQWYALLRSLALHCDSKVIFVNRVGFEDGLGFWGGSCVIDNDASMLCELPIFDKIQKTVEIKI